MDMDIDAGDIERFAARTAKADRIVRDEMVAGMKRSTLHVEGRAKRHVPVDTGHLRRSLTSQVKPFSGGVRGLVGTNVPYAQAVEKGRRAGAPMPPRGALLGWIRRHGGNVDAEFVIRRAISRRGIKSRPYLSRALKEMRPTIRVEFRRVAKRIAQRVGRG